MIFCAALLCAGTKLVAQEQQETTTAVQQLDEVVVTDSRFALKREHSGKTVVKITQKELERMQGRTVPEILNRVAGLELTGSRGRMGETLGVYARGGRGRQVLVLVDGVRISDPSSSAQEYDLRLLGVDNIESIEIVKGAASTLYGTNAATAVISITTKKAAKKPISGSFASTVGTAQTKTDQNYNLGAISNSARLSGTLQKFTYAAGVQQAYQNGLSSLANTTEKDPFSRYNLDAKLGYQFSDQFGLSVFGNHTKTENAYDESYGMMDAPYHYYSTQDRAGLNAQYSYGKGSLQLNAAYTDFDSEDVSAYPGTYKGSNWVMDVFHKYQFGNGLYTVLGVNYIDDRAQLAEEKDFTITDPYANVVYVTDFGLNLNAGLRMNNHSEYGSHWVYSVNPSYAFSMGSGYLKLMGSYATSYITPSLSQLFGAFGANPDLDPEEDRTMEAGVEVASSESFRWNVLYFNRKEDSRVVYGLNGYENAGDNIKASGVETEVAWDVNDFLHFNANYAFTERKGDNAIRIPKHKVNAVLSATLAEGTFASLGYQYTGDRLDTDFGTYSDVALEPYSLVDLSLSHQLLHQKLTLFFNVNNLLNEDYVEVIGYTTRGRNMSVGMHLNL